MELTEAQLAKFFGAFKPDGTPGGDGDLAALIKNHQQVYDAWNTLTTDLSNFLLKDGTPLGDTAPYDNIVHDLIGTWQGDAATEFLAKTTDIRTFALELIDSSGHPNSIHTFMTVLGTTYAALYQAQTYYGVLVRTHTQWASDVANALVNLGWSGSEQLPCRLTTDNLPHLWTAWAARDGKATTPGGTVAIGWDENTRFYYSDGTFPADDDSFDGTDWWYKSPDDARTTISHWLATHADAAAHQCKITIMTTLGSGYEQAKTQLPERLDDSKLPTHVPPGSTRGGPGGFGGDFGSAGSFSPAGGTGPTLHGEPIVGGTFGDGTGGTGGTGTFNDGGTGKDPGGLGNLTGFTPGGPGGTFTPGGGSGLGNFGHFGTGTGGGFGGLGATGGLGAGGGPGAGAPGAGEAGAAEAAMAGRMPMMPMSPGAGGNREKSERQRASWLPEADDVWGGDTDVAPPVL